ncbi:MAG: hypothetical protein FD131_286 [Rhodocyclaceae bacterium]|nr:MAG: hypothetical protein FD131_286 [Rhodocyclaceae bacterium]
MNPLGTATSVSGGSGRTLPLGKPLGEILFLC